MWCGGFEFATGHDSTRVAFVRLFGLVCGELKTVYLAKGCNYKDVDSWVSEVSAEPDVGAPVGAPVYVGPRVHMYIES